MLRILARLLLASAPVIAVVSTTQAHDTWINHGGFTGKGQAAGEWCCGEGDCAVMDSGTVTPTRTGYRIHGFGTIDGVERVWIDDVVPDTEAQPSPDGSYWRCKRPDGSRRCFFAPPEGS